jgi:hypothetical protein
MLDEGEIKLLGRAPTAEGELLFEAIDDWESIGGDSIVDDADAIEAADDRWLWKDQGDAEP